VLNIGGMTTGALAPPRTAEGRAGGWYGRGSPPPLMGVRGYYPRKNLGNIRVCSKSCIFVQTRQLVLYFNYKAATDFVLNATYKFCGGYF